MKLKKKQKNVTKTSETDFFLLNILLSFSSIFSMFESHCVPIYEFPFHTFSDHSMKAVFSIYSSIGELQQRQRKTLDGTNGTKMTSSQSVSAV